MQRSPQCSVHRHLLTMQIIRWSLHRILKADLKFHPYKLQVVHELRPIDRQMRIAFYAQLKDMFAENNILPNLLMSDEAHFHITWFVNKRNYRYWSDTNPQLLHETPQDSPKIRERCGVARFVIIGPYFFEDLQGSTIAVTLEISSHAQHLLGTWIDLLLTSWYVNPAVCRHHDVPYIFLQPASRDFY